MFTSSFAAGFALVASLIIAVGAQNAFVLRQGLRREHVGGIVLFCIAADVALMSAGVAGLGAVLGQVPGLTPGLTLFGTTFLAWYGIGALRRALRPEPLALDLGGSAAPLRAALGRAAGFTLLNPHVYIDTVLLMGAVGATQPAGGRPGFLLGASLASALWFAGLGYGARFAAPLFVRPLAWRVLDAGVALTMLALAARLLLQTLAGRP